MGLSFSLSLDDRYFLSDVSILRPIDSSVPNCGIFHILFPLKRHFPTIVSIDQTIDETGTWDGSISPEELLLFILEATSQHFLYS